MESPSERWRYGIWLVDQPKRQLLLKALERLCSCGLMAAMVVAAFHHRRVLPLMAQRQRLFKMTPGEPIDGIQLSAITLSDKEVLRQGMRDVRASPLPVPEVAERWAANRAHAEAYKERKDAKKARRKRKSLERDEQEKRRQQQSRKHQAEALALAPHKVLKVSTISTARWVVEVQAAIQRGAASARADPKEPVAQGETTKVAMKQAREEAPTPREAKALELGEVKVPSIAEATEGEVEAPRTSEAEVAEARASRASKAEVVDVGALRTTEAEVVEAGLGAAEPVA
ncbi:eukaryotic translation initiation factor 5B-like [Miscanthus floridulus]|uniref:eukaryotic translation initiation factor 5B-like n=1 Tax=Miscanthus floridulus TaxID=154761 RepID=UPI003457A008